MAGRRTRAPPRPKRDWLYLAIGAALLASLGVYAMGALAPDAGFDAGGGEAVPVDEISHVHGLAVNPERPHELLVATHYGLIRGTNDTTWERIGPVQDYMGFTAHPTRGDVFWASGHPARGGNLGVLRSDDAGTTWRQVALEGVDFHAMTVSRADPDLLWGYYRSQLYRSTDGAGSWSVVNDAAPRLASLAADPQARDTLYASTDEGIQRSTDGGASFEVVAPVSALGLAAHPTDGGVLYAATPVGVEHSADGGATWTLVASAAAFGNERPAYVALDPSAPEVLYLATMEGGIHKSSDAGASWRAVGPNVPAES